MLNLKSFVDWSVWWLKVRDDNETQDTSSYRYIKTLQDACFSYVNSKDDVFTRLYALSSATSQRKSLEKALNDIFDSELRRIQISTSSDAIYSYMGQDSEDYTYTLDMGTDAESYNVFMYSQGDGSEYRVTIIIPADLSSSEAVILQIASVIVRSGSIIEVKIIS